MIAGARVEVAPFKEDPMDFVLWKPSDADLPGWDSPWGRGRPGWHIECSAMSHELLGAAFDIHGGGLDLQFPHHENEIAQSHCAHPDAGFAKVWMHNEMLQVEGKKMSKSLGNFFTVRDLLDKGVPGEVIRLVFLGTHYSKPMDWTAEKAQIARNHLRRWWELLGPVEFHENFSEVPVEVLAAISNDLDTNGAITAMFGLEREGRIDELAASAKLLGLLCSEESRKLITAGPNTSEEIRLKIESVVAVWIKARRDKNFLLADDLSKRMQSVGIKLIALRDNGSDWKHINPDGLSEREQLHLMNELNTLLGEFK
jgi:cysteinyl-tRNA synthetase